MAEITEEIMKEEPKAPKKPRAPKTPKAEVASKEATSKKKAIKPEDAPKVPEEVKPEVVPPVPPIEPDEPVEPEKPEFPIKPEDAPKIPEEVKPKSPEVVVSTPKEEVMTSKARVVLRKLNPNLADGRSKWVFELVQDNHAHEVFRGSYVRAHLQAENYCKEHNLDSQHIQKSR